MRQRVEVEQLHHDRGAQLLRRLEEADEERRFKEIVHEPSALFNSGLAG